MIYALLTVLIVILGVLGTIVGLAFLLLVFEAVRGDPIARAVFFPKKYGARADALSRSRRPAPPVSEFLTTWDARIELTTHAAVLECLPRGIAQAFDPANMPCRRSETGEHDWADHTFYVERFGSATQRRVGGWRCLACEARTNDSTVIAS